MDKLKNKGLKASKKKAQEPVLVLGNKVDAVILDTAELLGKSEEYGLSSKQYIKEAVVLCQSMFSKFDYAEWTQAVKNLEAEIVKAFDISVSRSSMIVSKDFIASLDCDKPKKVGKDAERMAKVRAENEKEFGHMSLTEMKKLLVQAIDSDENERIKQLMNIMKTKVTSEEKDTQKVAKEFIKQQKEVISAFTKNATKEQLVGIVAYIQTI
tara:strand:+ start:212 stop:844 length:633 start_codon:yes stop_codon:yes gene_type:complete